MHVRLVPVPRLPRGQFLPLLALFVWVGLVLCAVRVTQRAAPALGLCHFKQATGLPCPGCGSTRVVLRAAEADLLGSFQANPLMFGGMLILTVVLGLRFLAGRRLDFGLTARQRTGAWVGLGAAVLLNWIYVIAFVG